MKERPGIFATRTVGAVTGILGTLCVVAGGPLAGYWLWTVANACRGIVSVARRDWFPVAMFACYQAATVYGLLR